MKCQIPSSSVLMTAKRNKKNAATTLLHAINLEKLIMQTKSVKLKRNYQMYRPLYNMGIVQNKGHHDFFPRHQYNNAYTREVYKQAINNLCPGQMIKVQDFSENDTWLVPDEIQSLHWS